MNAHLSSGTKLSVHFLVPSNRRTQIHTQKPTRKIDKPLEPVIEIEIECLPQMSIPNRIHKDFICRLQGGNDVNEHSQGRDAGKRHTQWSLSQKMELGPAVNGKTKPCGRMMRDRNFEQP